MMYVIVMAAQYKDHHNYMFYKATSNDSKQNKNNKKEK